MPEIKSLTGLRGVAALYVVLFHFFIGAKFSNPVATFVAHGYLSVDLFFLLSGFVMTLTYRKMFDSGWCSSAHAKFLGRRIARIYPLYLISTLVGFGLASFGLIEGLHQSSALSALLPNILMIQNWGLAESLDAPGWSISAEWAAYLLFPLLLWVNYSGGRSLAILSLAASCLGIILLSRFSQAVLHRPNGLALLDVHEPACGLSVLRCLPEFSLGILTYRF